MRVPANEDWRNDPERLQAAADLHADWMAACDEAAQHLKAAADAFQGLNLWRMAKDSSTAALAYRVECAVNDGLRELAGSWHKPANETLIGNMAAFGIGSGDEDKRL